MRSRRTPRATLPPALQAAPAEPTADEGAAHRTARLPYWAKNRVQRVRDRRCPACGDPILRAPRGPAPRYCLACDVGVRRLRQLRAYLRAAERLAAVLDRPAVAAAAAHAVVLLDAGERTP